MDKRDITILKHMLKYCNEIEKTINRFGSEIENFKKDNDYKDSLSMKIFQIGELANHLTDEYLEMTKNGELPAVKIGRRYFYLRSALEEWKQKNFYTPAWQKVKVHI